MPSSQSANRRKNASPSSFLPACTPNPICRDIMTGLFAPPIERPRTLVPSRPLSERRTYSALSSGSGVSDSNSVIACSPAARPYLGRRRRPASAVVEGRIAAKPGARRPLSAGGTNKWAGAWVDSRHRHVFSHTPTELASSTGRGLDSARSTPGSRWSPRLALSTAPTPIQPKDSRQAWEDRKIWPKPPPARAGQGPRPKTAGTARLTGGGDAAAAGSGGAAAAARRGRRPMSAVAKLASPRHRRRSQEGEGAFRGLSPSDAAEELGREEGSEGEAFEQWQPEYDVDDDGDGGSRDGRARRGSFAGMVSKEGVLQSPPSLSSPYVADSKLLYEPDDEVDQRTPSDPPSRLPSDPLSRLPSDPPSRLSSGAPSRLPSGASQEGEASSFYASSERGDEDSELMSRAASSGSGRGSVWRGRRGSVLKVATFLGFVKRILHRNEFIPPPRPLHIDAANFISAPHAVEPVPDPLENIKAFVDHLHRHSSDALLKITLRMQAIFRGGLHRKKAAEVRKMHEMGFTWAHVKAAKLIQKRVRGIKARKAYRFRTALVQRWGAVFEQLMHRVHARQVEFVKRLLKSAKHRPVSIRNRHNEMRLAFLGYCVGQRGLLEVPEGVRMLGRVSDKMNQTYRSMAHKMRKDPATMITRTASDGSAAAAEAAPRKHIFVPGKSFPFNIWKHVKAPRWSLLKPTARPVPEGFACPGLQLVTYGVTEKAAKQEYFARCCFVHDVPSREAIFHELDALLRLRTELARSRRKKPMDLPKTYKQYTTTRRRSIAVSEPLQPSYQRMYVTCVSACIDPLPVPRLVLLLEAQDTNLEALSHRVMPEAVLCCVTHQILQSLFYLHRLGLIHNGLDASAIYVMNSGRAKLGNFGDACYVDGETCRGKLSLMAPERLLCHSCSQKSDVWSLGLLMFQLLTGVKQPFGPPANSVQYKEKVLSHDTLRLPWNGPYTRKLHAFVEACLDRNAGKRPAVAELLSMPFGSNVKRGWPADTTAQAVLANWVAKVRAGHGDAAGDAEERSALTAGMSHGSSADSGSDAEDEMKNHAADAADDGGHGEEAHANAHGDAPPHLEVTFASHPGEAGPHAPSKSSPSDAHAAARGDGDSRLHSPSAGSAISPSTIDPASPAHPSLADLDLWGSPDAPSDAAPHPPDPPPSAPSSSGIPVHGSAPLPPRQPAPDLASAGSRRQSPSPERRGSLSHRGGGPRSRSGSFASGRAPSSEAGNGSPAPLPPGGEGGRGRVPRASSGAGKKAASREASPAAAASSKNLKGRLGGEREEEKAAAEVEGAARRSSSGRSRVRRSSASFHSEDDLTEGFLTTGSRGSHGRREGLDSK